MVTDGSREVAMAVRAAVELVNGTGSELYVVHVVSTAQEMPYPHPLAKERSEALLQRFAVKLVHQTLWARIDGYSEDPPGEKMNAVASAEHATGRD